MASRLNLQKELCNILGNNNVYFQPPESVKLKYDCIVYSLDGIDTKHADNGVYILNDRYSITYIHTKPETDIIKKLILDIGCKHTRQFVLDNLYHDVYTLYY